MSTKLGAQDTATVPPTVAAVVLTWNDTKLSGDCIASVLANDYSPIDVILVDNGSVEPCGAELARRFPEIETVVLEHNQGFTGGSNRGLERALDRGADYVLLLNNDTVLEQRAVGRLVEALEEHPKAGAAGALLLSPGAPGEPQTVRFYQAQVYRDVARHIHPEDGLAHNGREWPTVETEFAPACAILFRKEMLRQVGLFDEQLGTNWEDYDFSLRVRDQGWKILTVGGAEVQHLHGATTGRVSPYITYFYTRNRLICLFRYGRLPGILRQLPLILRSFYWQVKGYGFTNWRCHLAFVRGILDFLFGFRGEGRAPASRVDIRSKK